MGGTVYHGMPQGLVPPTVFTNPGHGKKSSRALFTELPWGPASIGTFHRCTSETQQYPSLQVLQVQSTSMSSAPGTRRARLNRVRRTHVCAWVQTFTHTNLGWGKQKGPGERVQNARTMSHRCCVSAHEITACVCGRRPQLSSWDVEFALW